MRGRLVLTIALTLLAASCGGGEGYFPAITPGSTSPSATTVPGGAEPTTAAPGWVSTTTFPAGQTTTSTMPPVGAWAFSRVDDAGVFGGPEDQEVSAVAVGGPGLVAVGSDFTGGDFDGAVWTSPDGLVWSRLPHDEVIFGGTDYQRMRALVAAGPGLVAVGYDGAGGDWDAAVWTSPDGLAWTRLPHDEAALGGPDRQGMTRVVVGGPGLVAAGFDQSGGDWDAAVWTSPDGLAWSRVPHDEAIFGGADDQYLDGLASVGTTLVAVGSDYSSGEGDATAWTSADGLTWSRLTQEAFGGSGDRGMSAVVAVGSGLVAVGYDDSGGDGDAAVWTSPDGLTWSRAEHDEAVFGGPDGQGMSVLIAAGGRLVAVGADWSGGDRDVAVWTSPDGLAWSRVPHDEAIFGGPGDQYVSQMLAGGQGLVAVGQDDTGADRNGLVWSAMPAG